MEWRKREEGDADAEEERRIKRESGQERKEEE